MVTVITVPLNKPPEAVSNLPAAELLAKPNTRASEAACYHTGPSPLPYRPQRRSGSQGLGVRSKDNFRCRAGAKATGKDVPVTKALLESVAITSIFSASVSLKVIVATPLEKSSGA